MKLRNLIIGSAIAGGILICAGSVSAYQYVSKLNHQLDTYVLPHTTFEGISIDGKTKADVQKTIQQKIDESNKKSVNYVFKDEKHTYTWQELGIEYKATDITDKIFKEQKGNISNRYNMRKEAETGELKRDYKLEPSISTAKYDAFIKEKYNDSLVDPVDADLSISGTTITINESKEGEKVDKEKLKILTTEAVMTNKQDIQVPITAVKPERSTEDVQNMGIQEVIAEYSTPLAGRNSSQTFNVQRAVNTLTGVFVAPDQTFSFNGRVGITDAAHGYKSAAVYVNGKVAQSAGGGVCQVSSTLYGAVLRADLGVVDRSNHSLPVHYLPLGQDAAVADYGPDLKFKNNTGKYIYIQSFTNGSSVTARIFGTNTGKNVVVSSKVISETDNNIVAVTYKKVTQNGQVLSNGQISKSTYKKDKKAS